MIGLFLLALTGVSLSLVVTKPLRYEVWFGTDLYSRAEETVFVALFAVGLCVAFASVAFAVILAAHWVRNRARFASAIRFRLRDTGFVAVAIVGWYVASFACFFSLDASFTRLGGTTPLCYDNPYFQAYDPLWQMAVGTGLRGGDRLLLSHDVPGASDRRATRAARFVVGTAPSL